LIKINLFLGLNGLKIIDQFQIQDIKGRIVVLLLVWKYQKNIILRKMVMLNGNINLFVVEDLLYIPNDVKYTFIWK
jgi:hypothetical protein